MIKQEVKIINMLANIELRVSKLYKIYAQKYPEYKKFWLDLVKEEENHAQLMKAIGQYVKKGTIKFDIKKCSEGAVETVLNDVEDRVERAKQHIIPLRDVFSSALQIEKNLIEKNFCSFFEGDFEEFKKMCEIITWETNQHRDKLEKIHQEISATRS